MPIPDWIESNADALRYRLGEAARNSAAQPLPLPFPAAPLPAPQPSTDSQSSMLSTAIAQLYTARTAFTEDSRSALTIMLLAYSAGGAILMAWLRTDAPHGPAQSIIATCIAALAFAIPFFARRRWMDQVETGYELYVAACLHAAVIAKALDMPLTHQWLVDAVGCGEAKGNLFRRTDQGEWTPADDAPLVGISGFNDIYRFEPDPSAGTPVLDNANKIIAVWKASPGSFYGSYRWVFTSALKIASSFLLLVTLACVVLALWRPMYLWTDREVSQPPTVAMATSQFSWVPVKVTHNLQPVGDGTAIRIAHDTAYTLDVHGEARLPGECRGKLYEILNRRGTVVSSGLVPSQGVLLEPLE